MKNTNNKMRAVTNIKTEKENFRPITNNPKQ